MFHLKKLMFKLVRMSNLVLLLTTLVVIFGSSFYFSIVEPDTFDTPWISFWYVLTTITTVGYGDYSPVTVAGQAYAVFLYIIGIGLLGVVIGKVVDGLGVYRKLKEEGQLPFKGSNHVVIFDWSKKARLAVEEITETELNTDIVVIDTLEKEPISHPRVHYIRGDGTDSSTLEKANVSQARTVIIYADDSVDNDMLADGKTMLLAASVEKYASKVHTIVELKNEKHVSIFDHIKVDEFVLSDETISRMTVRSSLHHGVTKIYNQLLSRKIGDDLYQIEKSSKWRTYRDAYNDLLNSGATLLSDSEELGINRKLDETIPSNAKLHIVCNDSTIKVIQEKFSS